MPNNWEQYKVKTEEKTDDWEKYRVSGRQVEPSYGEPTLPEAAWTGLKGGLAGAVGMYEKALELPLRPLGIPETPLKRVQEWLTPSEEESRRLETAGIPAKIAAGFGGIPGAVAKYGPATALIGPVGGFAVPEAIEAAERGPWEMAKAGAKGAAIGLGFKYLQPLGIVPRMGGMAGMFGGEALLETGKPREAIAPAVVGAGIGLMGGRRRATAPPEARPEPEPITEPTRLLPYRPRELEWWRGPGAKGVEGIPIPEGPLALPPGQGFLMREPTKGPTRPMLRPAPLRGMPYDIDPITGEPISALPPVPGRPRGPSPVGTPGLWMPEEQIPPERVAPPPVEGPPRPPAEPSPPALGVAPIEAPTPIREMRKTRLPLDPEMSGTLMELRDIVRVGEPGFKKARPAGGTISWGSTYPPFMQNKGWTKVEVLKAIDNGLEGKRLGKRQREIFNAAQDEARGIVRDRTHGSDPELLKDETINRLTSTYDDEIMGFKEELRDKGYSEGLISRAVETLGDRIENEEIPPDFEGIKTALATELTPKPAEPRITPELSPTEREQYKLPGMKIGVGERPPAEVPLTLEGTPLGEAARRAEVEKVQPELKIPKIKKPPIVSGFDREGWGRAWDWLKKEGWKKEETDKGVDIIAPDGERITKFSSQIDPSEPESTSVWILNKGLRNEWLARKAEIEKVQPILELAKPTPSPLGPGIEEKLIPKTFRQFVESRGTKWPLKSTDPQAESLKTEWDNLSKTGHVGEIFAGEMKKGDRLLKEGELYTVTEKTKDRMTIKDGETYQLDPKTGRIQGRKLEKGEEPFIGPGAASAYEEKLKERKADIFNAYQKLKEVPFVKEDVMPKAAYIGANFGETMKRIKELVAPTRGIPPKDMDALSRFLGEREETTATVNLQTEHWRNKITRELSPEDQITFVGRVQKGQISGLPEWQREVAEMHRTIENAGWEDANKTLKDVGRKEAIAYLKDHVTNVWKTPPRAMDESIEDWIKKRGFKGISRRPLAGTADFLKHQVYNLEEGIANGGVPYTTNLLDLTAINLERITKYTSAHKMLAYAKDVDKHKFIKLGQRIPEGYTVLPDKIAQVYFPTEAGMVHAGRWVTEEGIARLITNYLSHDYIREHPAWNTVMDAKNAWTFAEMAFSLFHPAFITIEASASKVGEGMRRILNQGEVLRGAKDILTAPGAAYGEYRIGRGIKEFIRDKDTFLKTEYGKKLIKQFPDLENSIHEGFLDGMTLGLPQDYRTQYIKTFRENLNSKNYIGAALRSIPALNETLMKPVFNQFIPDLKWGVYFKELALAKLERANDLSSGKITERQLGREVRASVEWRFGEMNFNNLWWNRTFKSALQLVTRSVTWKYGTIQQFGKAITGQAAELRAALREGRTPRLTQEMAWLWGITATTMTIGYIVNKMLGKKEPEGWRDLIYPQIDEEGNRVSLPTYWRDPVSAYHSPFHYLTASSSGYIGRLLEVISNKDFYGTQIHDPEENILMQRIDDMIHLAPLPFSFQTWGRMREQGVSPVRQLTGFLGAPKAPYWIQRTDAENLASDLAGQKFPVGGMAKERRKKLDLIRDYTRQWKQAEQKGEPTDNILANIQSDISGGRLTRQDLMNFRQRITREPIEQSILRLSLKEALRVWDKATDDEKTKIRPYILRKFTRSHPEEREVALPKMQQIQQEELKSKEIPKK